MKKRLTLFSILLLPPIIYIYFALGVPKTIRAPFFGPRHAIEVKDKNGNPKTDTAYYSIPPFQFKTINGGTFDSKSLDGHLYLALFVDPDSMKSKLSILAEDILTNKLTFNYSRFVFFYPGDSLGNPTKDSPDFARDLKLGTDTAITIYVTPSAFDSLRNKEYFIPDANRKKNPWITKGDAVLIDHKGRIRGYYDIRYAAEVKKMKEDVRFIMFRDEAAETIDNSTVEQKKK
jgi:protein SCO1/2